MCCLDPKTLLFVGLRRKSVKNGRFCRSHCAIVLSCSKSTTTVVPCPMSEYSRFCLDKVQLKSSTQKSFFPQPFSFFFVFVSFAEQRGDLFYISPQPVALKQKMPSQTSVLPSTLMSERPSVGMFCVYTLQLMHRMHFLCSLGVPIRSLAHAARTIVAPPRQGCTFHHDYRLAKSSNSPLSPVPPPSSPQTPRLPDGVRFSNGSNNNKVYENDILVGSSNKYAVLSCEFFY